MPRPAWPQARVRLYLNGTSAQSISGTQAFKTLNFVSNNSAGITLNNDLSVSGIHTFYRGHYHLFRHTQLPHL